MSPMEATVDPPSPGSRLDADHPENGVLIPCRFTVSSILGSNIEILRDALDLVRPKKRLLRATSPVRDGTP
jgi:hypothetical protein